jgi:hypothetical protein
MHAFVSDSKPTLESCAKINQPDAKKMSIDEENELLTRLQQVEQLHMISRRKESQITQLKFILKKTKNALLAAQNNVLLCIVCVENPRDCIIQPCKHVVCCRQCCAKIMFCPICRTRIVRSEHVYFA